MSRQEEPERPGSELAGAYSDADCSSSVRNATPSSLSDDESTQPQDPALARLAETWADLPEVVRRGIVAMVDAAGGESDR